MKYFIAKSLLIISFVFPCSILAQGEWQGQLDEDNNRHGTWILLLDSKMLERHNYDHGQLDGEFEVYFESGLLRSSTMYRDGVLEGSYAEYYDNSENSPRVQGRYEFDKKTGRWVTFYPNKVAALTENYQDGILNGTVVSKYISDRVDETIEYKNGVMSGSYSKQYDNTENSTFETGEMLNGARVGEWITYHNNKEPSSRAMYVAGRLSGVYEEYSDTGVLLHTGEYDGENPVGMHLYYDANGGGRLETYNNQGARSGAWEVYGAEGKSVSKHTYSNGRLNGPAVYYDSVDGVKDYELNYIADQRNGPYTRYGRVRGSATELYIREKGQYLDDQKDGLWSIYDQENNELHSQNWLRDQLHGVEYFYTQHYTPGEDSASVMLIQSRNQWMYGVLEKAEEFHVDWYDQAAQNLPEGASGFLTPLRLVKEYYFGELALQEEYFPSGERKLRYDITNGIITEAEEYDREGNTVAVMKYENGQQVSRSTDPREW